MRRLPLFALALLLLPATAEAQIWRANGRADFFSSVGTAATNYSLDGTGTLTRAYSFRRLLTAYATNKAVNIIRASDSGLLDVGFTATGEFDTATALTHCNATTCKLVTWYDQSGNAANITQGTDANRYAIVFNCNGTQPCIQATAATQTHILAGTVPATGLATLATVANRSVGTGVCSFTRENANNNRLTARNATAGMTFGGGASGAISTSEADDVWKAAIGVMDGTPASVLNVNGIETTGTVTGNTTSGAVGIVGAASTTCNEMELVIWDNIGLTADLRAYYINAARAWWYF